jgi:hypothetical protein
MAACLSNPLGQIHCCIPCQINIAKEIIKLCVVVKKQEANQSAAANRNLVPCMYYYFACNLLPRHPLSQHHNVNCYEWLMMMTTTNPLPLIIHFKSVQPPFTILTQDLLQQQ